MTKIGIRPESTPSIPAKPDARKSGLLSTAPLPSWMYRDPAEVAERLELRAQAKVVRQEKERARRRPEEQGLTPGTVRTMRRLRIRELVQNALKGRR